MVTIFAGHVNFWGVCKSRVAHVSSYRIQPPMFLSPLETKKSVTSPEKVVHVCDFC